MNSSARKLRAPVRLPYQLIWGFRCSRLTAFHSLLETASSIFISLLIHLFSLVITSHHYSSLFVTIRHYSSLFVTIRDYLSLLVTIRDYSQYSVVIRVLSLANDGRLVSIPAFVSRSRVSRRLLYIFFYHRYYKL